MCVTMKASHSRVHGADNSVYHHMHSTQSRKFTQVRRSFGESSQGLAHQATANELQPQLPDKLQKAK